MLIIQILEVLSCCASHRLNACMHLICAIHRISNELRRDKISNNVVCATSEGSDQPAHTRICLPFEYSMSVKLLTEHHLMFLSLKEGCTGSSESTLVKMPHCWKSHVMAQIIVSHALFAISAFLLK